MAQLRSKWKERIIDLIWPRLTGDPEGPPKCDASICDIDTEFTEEIKKVLMVRMDQADSRNEIIDRKLLSLFRVTSLLATVSIAVFVGAANLTGINPEIPRWLAVCSILTILYIFLQMFRAVIETSQGLRASGYERLGRNTLIPRDSDTLNIYNRRQILNIMYIIEQNEWATNQKVNSMEVAYTAVRNAVWSLPVLMLIAVLLSFTILM